MGQYYFLWQANVLCKDFFLSCNYREEQKTTALWEQTIIISPSHVYNVCTCTYMYSSWLKSNF